MMQIPIIFLLCIFLQESKQNITAREICFNIKKMEDGPYWPRLVKDAKKPGFLHTDFSRWKDEDDSEEEDTAIDDNFESVSIEKSC